MVVNSEGCDGGTIGDAGYQRDYESDHANHMARPPSTSAAYRKQPTIKIATKRHRLHTSAHFLEASPVAQSPDGSSYAMQGPGWVLGGSWDHGGGSW